MNRFASLDPLAKVFAALLFSSWAVLGWAQGPQATTEPESVADVTLTPLDDPSIDLEELSLRVIPLTLDEVEPLALAWQERASEASQAVVEKTLQIRATEEGPAHQALRDERVELLDARAAVFDRFNVVVDDFAAKGGDPALVETLRAFASTVVVAERVQWTLEEFYDNVVQWLISPDGGVQIAFRIAVIVGSLIGLFLVARIIRAWARRFFGRVESLSKLLQGFLVMVVYWLTIAFGLMVVLTVLGINITPLFALVGGASFIIAFALQDTLGNLASGLMIMLNRPFDEGDFVVLAGLSGTVTHVSVVNTTITTPDNQVIMIPNSKVWGDVITNVTASDTRRVDLVFGISYGDSIEKAQEVLEGVVSNHPLVLDDPETIIRVSELADSSVNFIARPWVRTSDYWAVYWDLQRGVKEAFDANGISIPFPQTDMHFHVTSDDRDSPPAKALAGAQTESSSSASGSFARHGEGPDEGDDGDSGRS